ncbi:MAG: hypothetical protein ACREVO_10210, partial [Steroidobacteraceae bacterium]
GMKRVGCMPCINCGKDELLEISKRAPHHIDRIREWERLVMLASKRGWTTFFCDAAEVSLVPIPGWRRERRKDEETGIELDAWSEPDELIYGRLNIDARVKWAQSQRGGRKADWIRELMPAEACSSLYGLCE